MRPDVHLRPDRLLAHAATATALSDALLAAVRGPGRPADGEPAAVGPERTELERLDTALRRAVRELDELSAAIVRAVAVASRVDADAAHGLRVLDGP